MSSTVKEETKEESSTNIRVLKKGERVIVPMEKECEYCMGQGIFVHINHFDFLKEMSWRQISISPCAQIGLKQLTSFEGMSKSATPILVKSEDLIDGLESGLKVKEIGLRKYAGWDNVSHNFMYTYLLKSCTKHLMYVKEGQIVIFAMNPFMFKEHQNSRPKECIIAFEKGPAMNAQRVFCMPVNRKLKGSELILFDRRRVR